MGADRRRLDYTRFLLRVANMASGAQCHLCELNRNFPGLPHYFDAAVSMILASQEDHHHRRLVTQVIHRRGAIRFHGATHHIFTVLALLATYAAAHRVLKGLS